MISNDPVECRVFIEGVASFIGAQVHPCVEPFEHVLPEDSKDGDEVITFVLPTDDATPDKFGIYMFDLQVPVGHDTRVRVDVSNGPWIPTGLRSFVKKERIMISAIISGRGDELFWTDEGMDMALFASDEACPGGNPWIPFDVGIIVPGKPAEFFLQAIGEGKEERSCTMLIVGQLVDPKGCRFTADGLLYKADGTLPEEDPVPDLPIELPAADDEDPIAASQTDVVAMDEV